jgi:predicted glycogen debranching enzyme
MTQLGAYVRIGPGGCADPTAGVDREWLLTDGLGGYAMGTAHGLRTRRYHGLLTVATSQGVPVTRPGSVAQRHLALAALDPAVILHGVPHRLATDEWAGGVIDPSGGLLLSSVEVRPGTVVHRWVVGEVVVEREVAMVRGRSAVAVVHRIIRAPGPIRLELTVLGTWRDVHSDRHSGDGDPTVEVLPDGALVEGAWRVRGPGFLPGREWYRGVRYRQEAARGLADTEDLWHVGTFSSVLDAGDTLEVLAWAGALDVPPPPARQVVADAGARAQALLAAAGLPATPDGSSLDAARRTLVIAADHHITAAPGIVAGYPWFGEWSRDTMTSYEGLFLCTGRIREGAALLRRYAATVSQGMLTNTADSDAEEFNSVDATLWFVHALGRHVAATGDVVLARDLQPVLLEIVQAHLTGTRVGIGVDAADSLLRCGAAGDPTLDDRLALTWMDAVVDGIAVTPRHGKPVEVNALWVNALAVITRLFEQVGAGDDDLENLRVLHGMARASFLARFTLPTGGLADVVDAPTPAGPANDLSLRPNQLLAVSLPSGPLAESAQAAKGVVRAVAALVTPLGLRTLDPDAAAYIAAHRGDPADRDRAYHQGTVWPWLIGPYADAVRVAAGHPDGALDGLLDGLVGHLLEAGMGSVSETADGDAPHRVTGCPFQAWSVAELLRLLKPAGSLVPAPPH